MIFWDITNILYELYWFDKERSKTIYRNVINTSSLLCSMSSTRWVRGKKNDVAWLCNTGLESGRFKCRYDGNFLWAWRRLCSGRSNSCYIIAAAATASRSCGLIEYDYYCFYSMSTSKTQRKRLIPQTREMRILENQSGISRTDYQGRQTRNGSR